MSFARKVARRARQRELKRPGVAGFKVQCREHGAKPFRGDLRCAKCQTVHLIDEETMAHPTIDDKSGACSCGAMMFPVRDEAGKPMPDVPFFGHPVCHDCALKEATKQAEQKQ